MLVEELYKVGVDSLASVCILCETLADKKLFEQCNNNSLCVRWLLKYLHKSIERINT